MGFFKTLMTNAPTYNRRILKYLQMPKRLKVVVFLLECFHLTVLHGQVRDMSPAHTVAAG